MEPWQKLMATANDSTVDADIAEEVSDNDYQRKTLSLYTMTKSQSNKALSQWNDEEHKAFDLIVSHSHRKCQYDQGQSTGKPNSSFLFVTGAGGTGKSFVAYNCDK